MNIRRSPPRPWVRIASGVFAAATLVAIAFKTLQDADAAYKPLRPERPFPLRVPTRPEPVFEGETEPVAARFLVHTLVVEESAAGLRPLYAGTFDVRWKGEKWERDGLPLAGDIQADDELKIHASHFGVLFWEARKKKETAALVWNATVMYTVHYSGPRINGTLGGYVRQGEVCINHLYDDRWNHLFSTVSRPHRNRWICMKVTAAARDDPLQPLSAESFLNEKKMELRSRLAEHKTSPVRHFSAQNPALLESGFPGLLDHLGLSLFPLALAAGFLTLAVSGNKLVGAGVLLGVFLYAVALDRVVLSKHLSRFTSASEPTAARLIAGECAAQTFFYKKTVSASAAQVAEDRGAPPELRKLAEGMKSVR